MDSPLQGLRQRKARKRYIPGTRWVNKLSRDRQYDLEPLEPRYLLSATLYDPGDAGAPSGPPNNYDQGQAAVQNNIAAQVVSAFDQLAKLGNILNSDNAVETIVDETPLPFFQKSVTDMLGLGQADLDLGDFLIGNTDGATADYKDAADAYFAGTSTATTTGLQSALQSVLAANFSGGTHAVTDNSTTDLLRLDFSFDLSAFNTDIAFGSEAEEFYLTLEDGFQVTFDFDSFDFTLKADLTGIDRTTASPATANYNAGPDFDLANGSLDDSEIWFEFGGTNKGTLTLSGYSSHPEDHGLLAGQGVGFGLIAPSINAGDAGGVVSSTGAQFKYDLQLDFNFDGTIDDDGKITLEELRGTPADLDAVQNWAAGDEFAIEFPTDGDAGNNTYLNEARFFVPVDILNPGGDQFISGLNGVTGSFDLIDDAIMDDRAPLIFTDQTLASFSRILPDDLLRYVEGASAIIGQTSQLEEMQAFLPYLDLSLGEAYGFGEATDSAFYDPLRVVTNVITAVNAPSTSGDPLDFSGTATFDLTLVTGAAMSTETISITNATSVDDIIAKLNAAFVALSIHTIVQARPTGSNNPRVELVTPKETLFFLSNFSGDLDIGFDRNALVFARNGGSLTDPSGPLTKFTWGGVQIDATNPFQVTSWNTADSFTLQVGSDPAQTVNLSPGIYYSVAELAQDIQAQIGAANLYDFSSGEGVKVEAVAVGNGYGLQFTHTDNTVAAPPTTLLTIGGAAAAKFNLASSSGHTLTSAAQVAVSPFNMDGTPITFGVTVRKQDGGTLTTETATVSIPALNYTTAEGLQQSITSALSAAGLANFNSTAGVLVELIPVGGGTGLRFYGSPEVYEIQISGLSSAERATLGLPVGTLQSTAPFIVLQVTRGSGTSAVTTVTPVYFNGNESQDFFSEEANATVEEVVSDLKRALKRAGLLDEAAGTGVSVRAIESNGSSTETIEFFALNPGSGDDDISAIATDNASASIQHLDLGNQSSQNYTPSGELSRPNFGSIQEFVQRLNEATGVPFVQVGANAAGTGLSFTPWTANVANIYVTGTGVDKLELATLGPAPALNSDAAIDLDAWSTANTANRTLRFRVFNEFTVEIGDVTIELPRRSFTSIDDLAGTIQALLRAEGFDEGLLTSPAVYNAGDLANGVSPYFDFPIRFYVDGNDGLADLTDVELRFDAGYGSTSSGRISNLDSNSQQTVSRSADISFTLGVDLIQPDAAGGNLEFVLPVTVEDWDGSITDPFVLLIRVDGGAPLEIRVESGDITGSGIPSFVAALNAELTAQGLGSTLVASYATDDRNTVAVTDDLTLLRLVTTAGSASRVEVEVPEYADAPYTSGTDNSARHELGLAASYFPVNESLVVELPVMIPAWDGSLTLDARLEVILDDGVSREILVTVAEMEAFQSSGSPDLSTLDFIAVLNQKLSAMSYGAGSLSDILSFELDTLNQNARDVIRLVAAPGATRSLMVRVPEFAIDQTQVVDEGSDKFGFTTNLTPSESRVDYAPVAAANPENSPLNITGWLTDATPYQFSQDLVLAITFPDGTTRSVRVLASDTTGNGDMNALANDFDAAFVAVGINGLVDAQNNGGLLRLHFTGSAANTDTWRVEGGRDYYIGTATDPIIADLIVDIDGSRGNAVGFEMESDAFFTVKLPDGTFDVFQVEAADSVGATSIDDLVQVIQNAILAKTSLSDTGFVPKIDVSYVTVAANQYKIQFDLNPTFFPQGGTWSLQAGTRYLDGTSNGARFELLFAEETAVESQYAVTGPISKVLTAESDFQLSQDLNFDVSINGTGYVTVTVDADDTNGTNGPANTSIGDLVADINNALAATAVTVGSGNTAADFISAGVIANATRIQLRLNDNAPVNLINVRFDPGDAANNAYVAELGFPDFETRIGMRGSDPRIAGINLIGQAAVEDGVAAGTASFGYIDFAFGAADLDLLAASELRLSGITRMQDMARALSGYRAEYEASQATPFSVTLGIQDPTFAHIELQQLSIPGDPVSGEVISNLNFGANATIGLDYQPKGSGSGARIGVAGTDFDNPGAPDITFTNTNGVELLSRIGFIDVVGSLWRVGDMLSDWMNNDPTGPFKQKLFFAESGLVDIYDFGLAFNRIVDEISLNPPENLQQLARSLAIGLQIDASDIHLSLITSGTPGTNTFDAAINIAFELVRTVTATLPLFVDLATLRGRSLNAGLVEQSLLGLNSLSGNPTNPMEVEFSALSKLILDLDINLVENGTVIEPAPQLNQPASGHFFETQFFLTGDSYSGDVPAGANRLRLGFSWIDNEGNEVVAPGDLNTPVNPTLASTRPLTATYDGTGAYANLSAAAAEGRLVLDGVAVSVGDQVLIKDQADAAQNGVYTVVNQGSGTDAWFLTRINEQANAAELDWLKATIGGGVKNAGKSFMLKAVPDVAVQAVFSTPLAAGYQDFTQDGDSSNDHFLPLLTASANGALGSGVAEGDFVLLTNQTDPVRNGVYQVINLGDGSNPWKMVQMDIGKSTLGKAVYNPGTAQEYHVLKNPANGHMAVTLLTAGAHPPVNVVELRPSAVAVNATGEVALPDLNGTPAAYNMEAVEVDPDDIAAPIAVEYSTADSLEAAYDGANGTLTATTNGALQLGGFDPETRLFVNFNPADGDLILVNHQADAVQNGIYTVTRTGHAGQTWILTRSAAFDTIAELASAKIRITSGHYAGQQFLQSETLSGTLNDSIIRFSRLLDPVSYEFNLAAIRDAWQTPRRYAPGELADPVDVTVEAASTGVLNASYNSAAGTLTASNNGALILDGVAPALNDRVLVNHQSSASLNGIYVVTHTGDGSSPFVLTRDVDFDTGIEMSFIRVGVTGGAAYAASVFEQPLELGNLDTSTFRFLKLIDSTDPGFAQATSKALPYQVTAATTGAIRTTVGPGQVATYVDSIADGIYIESLTNGSINLLQMKEWDPISGSEITVFGIDSVTSLRVGDRILVKDQGRDTSVDPATVVYQGNSQNGIYEVVTLGDSETPWRIQRVDFADDTDNSGGFSADDFIELRVSVLKGAAHYNSRWIQTNQQLVNLSGNIHFSNEVSSIYGSYDVNGSLYQSWFDFNAVGQAGASLPMVVVLVPTGGGETVISKDLGSLTVEEKNLLGQLGSALINEDLYQSMPDLPTLQILIPDDTEVINTAFTGSGLNKFFNTSLIAVEFPSLPDLLRTVPTSDVLSQLRDWAYLGDALDLALFNLQFGMDRALGIEVPILGAALPRYTGFIEQFRDQLTTEIRERVRLDPLKPANALRDALYATLGPNGVGWLVDGADDGSGVNQTDIQIIVTGQTWNIDGDVASGDYGLTPEGVEFEAISGSAIEFAFALSRPLDDDTTAATIDTIQSGDETIGLTLSTDTIVQDPATKIIKLTEGGVHLRRAFDFNFGFGLDVVDGFYVFNPTKRDGDAANDAPLINVEVQAELDGDINAPGVQEYTQMEFASQLNLLSIRAIDGRPSYSDLPGGDGFHSGYFGNYLFDFNIADPPRYDGNPNTDPLHNRVGPNSAAYGVNVDQLRLNEVLAPENEPDGLMNFAINADADIHLMIESERDGLIPSYQTDFLYSIRRGSGYAPLIFNAALAGLGDVTIGADALSDATTGSTNLSADQWGSVSPAWRLDRAELVANGNEGTTFVSYQNVSIDVRDYLSGPVYDTVKWFDSTIEKIRPFITFMTTPIPGTDWMAQPVYLGTFLGTPFAIFVAVVNSIDKVLGQIPPAGGYNERRQKNPRVGMGGSYNGVRIAKEINVFANGNQARSDAYKQARADRELERDIRRITNGDDSDIIWHQNPLYEPDPNAPKGPQNDPVDDRSRIKKLGDALNEKATTPNKFSERFESFRDGNFYDKDAKPSGVGGSIKQAFKKAAADGLKQNDDRGGKKSLTPSLVGGGFQLDALRVENAINIFMGNNTDLLRVSIPKLQVTFSYTRFFPLPAFPPVGLTVGFSMSVFIQMSFGWDTTGFYWTTKDANAATLAESTRVPTFGFTFEFTVGVALNLGFAEAGVEAFLRIGVEFFWNTPEGSDKLRQDEISWLQDQGLSLFDVRVFGELGVRIYVDLIIPIPLVGPITIRIFQKEFSFFLFDEFIDIDSGIIQLAEKSGSTLRLNMGLYAKDRLFIDTDDRNEVFKVYSVGGSAGAGDDVVVVYAGKTRTFYSKYTGVKEIYGYVGRGATIIDAGESRTLSAAIDLEETDGSRGGTLGAGTVLNPLQYAAVSFIGGQGSTYLRAGQSYNPAFGRSRLQGGLTTATLIGGVTGLDLIAADGNTIIEGSTGTDKIVSRTGSDILRGNGGADSFYFANEFGRDRLYVTGTGNRVDFGGTTLSGHAGPLDSYTVPVNTNDGVKFQFGQLVQSVKQGINTAFFAVDPNGADSIDTWVGTDGDDIFNVFFFAPNKTLTIDGGQGDNFYNVFLGDPKKVYDKDPTVNLGTISINDNEGANGRLLLTQTFADTITYNSTEVINGREEMALSGLERIDLNAGDSTLIWGANAAPGGYEQILGGNVITGRIIIAGNVQLTGTADVELTLNRTLDVQSNLVVANADSGNERNLKINITNPNPLLTSDLYIGAGAGIFLNAGTQTASNGDGYGKITLNAFTGSIDNSPAETGGVIRARNGSLEMSARDSIGATGNPLFIDVAQVAGETFGLTNASGLQGIYLTSDQDINIRASAAKAGLTTVDGAIWIDIKNDLNPAAKLTYGEISAGSGRDITLIADQIELAGAYTVSTERTEIIIENVKVVTYDVAHLFVPVAITYKVFGFTYTRITWYYVTVYTQVVSYVPTERETTVVDTTSFAAGSGSINGTGQIIILNKTEERGIDVGNGGATPGSLSITKLLLDSLGTDFTNIIIGRDEADSVHTGQVNLFNYEYQDPVTFRGGGVAAGLAPTGITDPGKLSSTETIVIDAYDHDTADGTFTGQVTFEPTGVYEARSLTVFSDVDMVVQGSFLSTAVANGLLYFEAGKRTRNGGITLAGNFQTTAASGSDLRVVTGADSGDILITATATFLVDDLVSLNANRGGITQDSASGRITVDNLEVLAADSISIRTDINNLFNALISGTGNFTMDEFDDLILTRVRTTDGTILIQVGTEPGAAGSGDLRFTNPDNLNGIFSNIEARSATAGGARVTLDVAGAAQNLTSIDAGEFNVIADELVIDALGEINLTTDIDQLTARTASGALGQGAILIRNTGISTSPFILKEVTTENGLIQINTSHDLQADLVQTNRLTGVESSANTITLRTDTAGDGDILLGEVKTRGDADLTPGGHANVILSADGKILRKATGTSLITADDLLATAFGTALAPDTDVIHMNVALKGDLTAKSALAGDIVVTSAQSLLVRLVESTGATGILGDFRATLTGAASDLSYERIDAGSNDIYLTVGGRIIDLDTLPLTKITGDELRVISGGDTALDTGVNDFYVQVGGTGSLTVQESDSAEFVEVNTAGGPITIVTGIDDANPNDTTVLTSGNALIGQVRAGAASDQDITITTIGGAIQQLSSAIQLAKITGPPLLEGGLFTAHTFRGVGDFGNGTTIPANPLNVNVDTMVADTRQPGGINIIEIDNILLSNLNVVQGSIAVDAGGSITHDTVLAPIPNGYIDLDAQGGFIDELNAASRLTATHFILTALTGITANTNGDFLTATIAGTAGNMDIDEDSSITIRRVITPSGTFDLIVGEDGTLSRVDVDAATTLPTPHVTATEMILTTQKGVALPTGFMNAEVSTITATVSVDGGIYINNLLDVELKRITTADGMIHITGIGDITATLVETDTDATTNNILIDNSAGTGDILVNTITAGKNNATPGSVPPDNALVNIISGGKINAVDPATRLGPVNITGKGVDLDAQTGVGDIEPLLLTTYSLGVRTTTGGIGITNSSAFDFEVTNMTTGSGDINLGQLGGGNLTVRNIATGNGNVNIFVGDSATLFLFNSLSTNGNTTLSADEMEFLGGPNSIKGSGNLTITPFTPGIFTEIFSPVGGTPFESPLVLELAQRDIDAIDQNFGNIFIGALSPNQTTFLVTYDGFDYSQSNLENLLGGSGGPGGLPGSGTPLPNFTYGYQPLYDLLGLPYPGGFNNQFDDDEDPFFFQLTNSGNGYNWEELEQWIEYSSGGAPAAELADEADALDSRFSLAGLILMPLVSGTRVLRSAKRGARKLIQLLGCL